MFRKCYSILYKENKNWYLSIEVILKKKEENCVVTHERLTILTDLVL